MQEATRSIRQPEGRPEPEAWRKISAAWAVDEDISRLLKSLPNWLSLVEGGRDAGDAPTPSITSPPSHNGTANAIPEAAHQVPFRHCPGRLKQRGYAGSGAEPAGVPDPYREPGHTEED